jgi:hypothetical protein
MKANLFAAAVVIAIGLMFGAVTGVNACCNTNARGDMGTDNFCKDNNGKTCGVYESDPGAGKQTVPGGCLPNSDMANPNCSGGNFYSPCSDN